MAIRSSISGSSERIIDDDKPRMVKHADVRGSASLTANAYTGSTLDKLGVPQEIALSVGKGIAYIGRSPSPQDIPVQDLLSYLRMMNNPGLGIERTYRQRIRSPLTAIRGFCIECRDYSPKAVSDCDQVSCPLWALRMGKNGHHGKR